MRLVAPKTALAWALKETEAGCAARTRIPILGYARLTVSATALEIATTDLDFASAASIDLASGVRGSVCIPHDKLAAAVAGAPDGAEIAIELGASATAARLAYGRCASRLPTLPADDFPAMADDTDDPLVVDVDGAELAACLGRVSGCISREETRYYLNGVFLEVEESRDAIRLTATDGHRLTSTRCKAQAIEGVLAAAGVILPRLFVEACRALKGEVRLDVTEQRVRCSAGRVTRTSRLINGVYPDYRRIIPHELGGKASFSAGVAELGQALAQASWAADQNKAGRIVGLVIEDGRLTISAGGEHGQASSTEIDVDQSGPTAELGINTRYLQDMLRALPSERVRIFTTGSVGAIRLVCSDHPENIFVVMPVRYDARRFVQETRNVE